MDHVTDPKTIPSLVQNCLCGCDIAIKNASARTRMRPFGQILSFDDEAAKAVCIGCKNGTTLLWVNSLFKKDYGSFHHESLKGWFISNCNAASIHFLKRNFRCKGME